MAQEGKELYKRNHLIKDLCSRLPYEVKAYVKNWSKLDRKYYEGVYTVKSVYPSLNTVYVCSENGSVEVILGHDDYIIMPYLFPLSNMTDEQYNEYNNMGYSVTERGWSMANYHQIDWFHKNHIDYRNLIDENLAIDATGLNIY